MRRYKFLTTENVYDALNKLRSAFLAAKDGNEVEEIIKGLLTSDERLKIGRRILIAQALEEGLTYDEVKKELKVGKQTVVMVENKLRSNPLCFELVGKREKKVKYEYKRKAYQNTGGGKMILKKKVHAGFKRRDVRR
jgi:uncharacterized protein YerC